MATTTRRMAEEKGAGQKPDVSEQAQQVGSQLREAAGQAATAAQESGQKLAFRAKQEAQSYFNDRRDTVAVMMSDVVDATRQVAQTLRDRDDARIARYTETVADQVDELVQYVQRPRACQSASRFRRGCATDSRSCFMAACFSPAWQSRTSSWRPSGRTMEAAMRRRAISLLDTEFGPESGHQANFQMTTVGPTNSSGELIPWKPNTSPPDVSKQTAIAMRALSLI